MSLFWDWLYLFKQTPWDTGITPPEIVAMLESGRMPIGRALDLGCGTGTNAIYLTQHGFDVTAIDISRRAIALARRKARSVGVRPQFIRGDVTQMTRWVPINSIGFAYDIGCFHNLKAEARARYARHLGQALQPQAIYMLYAFCTEETSGQGVRDEEVRSLFVDFTIETVQHGGDRNRRPSAWYTLLRRAANDHVAHKID